MWAWPALCPRAYGVGPVSAECARRPSRAELFYSSTSSHSHIEARCKGGSTVNPPGRSGRFGAGGARIRGSPSASAAAGSGGRTAVTRTLPFSSGGPFPKASWAAFHKGEAGHFKTQKGRRGARRRWGLRGLAGLFALAVVVLPGSRPQELLAGLSYWKAWRVHITPVGVLARPTWREPPCRERTGVPIYWGTPPFFGPLSDWGATQ